MLSDGGAGAVGAVGGAGGQGGSRPSPTEGAAEPPPLVPLKHFCPDSQNLYRHLPKLSIKQPTFSAVSDGSVS